MCGGFHNEAEVGFKFSPKVLEHFLRKLYDGDFDTSTEIEPTAWREVLRILNAAVAEGVSQSAAPPTLESDFYNELRQSNGVFAAFKVHSMAEKMAALLTDADGKLKPFYQWKAEVEGIASHYVGPWLRTEYNTAVIRAHNAADWLQFERNRDILPNLRWMPTTSPNPEAEHKRFWSVKLTRPIDDPFWNKHRPGDRWNCKCSLEATDEPITPIPDDADDEKPQRGLRGNPAKTGQIFDKSHPYFPKNCASCGFNKKKGTITSRMMGWFNAGKMDCKNCPHLHIVTSSADIKRAKTFVDLIKDDYHAQRVSCKISTLSKKDVGGLKKYGLNLNSEDVYISDDRIQHALRTAKANARKSVSPEALKHFIENCSDYELFYDTTRKNLVFATTRNGVTMKFIVKPNSTIKENKKKMPANTFVTAGVIKRYNLYESHLTKIR